MKLKREHLLHFLWLGPLVLYVPAIFIGNLPYYGTVSLQFVPWRWLGWQVIQAGELPLWNPLLGFGSPLAANYQSAFFYPVTWLLVPAAWIGGATGIAWGQGVIAALHLALSGVGMARLAKRIGLGTLAQGISGLAYGLSGYLVARAHFLSTNAAATWLPWLMLCILQLVRGRALDRRRNAGRLGGVTAMLLLAGHAQTAWYSVMLAVLWLLFLWLDPKVAAHSHESSEGELVRGGASLSVAGWLLLGVLAGVLLAAVQLAPTAELLMASQRAGGADESFVMTYSFWPWRFLGLLLPGFFGSPVTGDYWGYANFWEDAIYIGLLPLLLSLRAVFRPDGDGYRSLSRFLSALTLLSFLLALGSNTPVFPFLYRHAPTFDLFQAPTRISILAVFSLSLLAGIGAQSWAAGLSSFSRRQARRWTAVAAAVSLAGAVAMLFLGFLPASFGRSVLTAGLVGFGAASLGLAKKRDTRWRYAVIFLVTLDLLVAGWGLNPGVSADFYADPAPNAAALRKEIGSGRMYLFADDAYEMTFGHYFRFQSFRSDTSELRSSLLPNLSVLDGLRTANQFDPLVPARYARWIAALESAPAERQSWLLSQGGITLAQRFLAGDDNPLRFEPRGAMPRTEWFACAEVVHGEDEAFSVLEAMAEARRMDLVVEGGAAGPCDPAAEGNSAVVNETSNSLVVRFEAPADGWLLLRDTFYPGWEADIDGAQLEVFPANGLFRAVRVPAGGHEVRFAYAPGSFKFGAIAAICGLILMVGLFYPGRRAVE